jgi:hypothetical protein
LHSTDLNILGVYLFGSRWQCPLARALHCSDRLVRFWVAQARPVSRNASKRIEQLVRHKHSDQMRRLRGFYVDMIAGLSGTAIRGRLMTIDLAELRLDDELRRAALSTVVAFPPPPSAGLPPGETSSVAA